MIETTTPAEIIRAAEDAFRSVIEKAAQQFVEETGLYLTDITAKFLDVGTAENPSATILGEVHVRWRVSGSR